MADAERIRAFVALELPEPVRAALTGAIDEVRPHAPGKVSWIAPEKLHLTLAFLGASDPGALGALEQALSRIAAARPPFTLELAPPGVFPSPRRPAVLWVGVREEPELQALQADVAEACRAGGWELEARPFKAHLTCARVKFPGPPGQLAAAWERASVASVRWQVDALSLMQSRTHPAGAVYTPLARMPLGG